MSWCIGELTAAFLCQMEEILHLYQLPYDPLRPLWCFDERPCQLIGDTLVPLPMQAGKPLRQNYEYERNGTCSVLLAVQPHTGRCFVQVRPQRTRVPPGRDYAEFMQALSQAHCPADRRIPVFEQLAAEVLAWVTQRNEKLAPIRWQFTPEMARIKFKRFYPHPSTLT